MYSLRDYGWMIADNGRTAAYAEALKRRVTPNSVVVEIGTGSGFFALLAARLGARKVYAIEYGDAIQFGRDTALANGLEGKIEFIQNLSTEVQLPEKADVVVCEIHGILPPFQGSLKAIMDARDRFLAPGGHLIPQRETLWAALVESAERHYKFAGVWGGHEYGIDMTAIRPAAVNSWEKAEFRPGELITAPERWAVLDYAVLASPHVRGETQWEIQEDRTAHGVGAWFDWEGVEGVNFSNSPLSGERHIFGQGFFPWPAPVKLRRGDRVHVVLRLDSVGTNYVQGWETSVRGPNGDTRATFRQSDFVGATLSTTGLKKRSSAYVPKLTDDGRMDLLILNRAATGATTLEQIARDLSTNFPHRFPSWTDAMSRVSDLSLRYSE